MTQAPDGRTPGQVADEQAMAHVSAVLTNLDWTIERARKRFFQDSYFPADTTRLL